MNQDFTKVKAKLTKLFKLSDHTSASAGEIENALAAATQLMLKHNLTREDIDLGDDTDPLKNLTIGRTHTVTYGHMYVQWENTLSWFVCEFLGTVKHYVRLKQKLRKDGIALLNKQGKQRLGGYIYFYGPQDDCVEAVELRDELAAAVAIAAQVKYASFWQGDGAAYAEGFVQGLRDAHVKAKKELASMDEATTALVLTNDKTLLAIRSKADSWLRDEAGIKLQSGDRRDGAGGSHAARNEGRADGRNYGVGRKTSTKRIS